MLSFASIDEGAMAHVSVGRSIQTCSICCRSAQKNERWLNTITYYITLFHMFDIQFLQVIFLVSIHHFIEYHVYLFIIALPFLPKKIVVSIHGDNCVNKLKVVI